MGISNFRHESYTRLAYASRVINLVEWTTDNRIKNSLNEWQSHHHWEESYGIQPADAELIKNIINDFAQAFPSIKGAGDLVLLALLGDVGHKGLNMALQATRFPEWPGRIHVTPCKVTLVPWKGDRKLNLDLLKHGNINEVDITIDCRQRPSASAMRSLIECHLLDALDEYGMNQNWTTWWSDSDEDCTEEIAEFVEIY